METATRTVARQIAYFRPSDDQGKWHAAWTVTHTAVCGTAVELSTDAIRTEAGQDLNSVHPIVCKRCLRLTAAPGVSAEGVAR
jgi:hypothetical protein